MKSNQTRLRVAIAGCHRMLSRTQISHNFSAASHNVPESKVVAVFDKNMETRNQFRTCLHDEFGDIPTYADFEK